jgi:hypothetical protein
MGSANPLHHSSGLKSRRLLLDFASAGGAKKLWMPDLYLVCDLFYQRVTKWVLNLGVHCWRQPRELVAALQLIEQCAIRRRRQST